MNPPVIGGVALNEDVWLSCQCDALHSRQCLDSVPGRAEFSIWNLSLDWRAGFYSNCICCDGEFWNAKTWSERATERERERSISVIYEGCRGLVQEL